MMRFPQLTEAEQKYLDDMDPADKALAYDKLLGSYAAFGHHSAYLNLDSMFEKSPLMRPWQRDGTAK